MSFLRRLFRRDPAPTAEQLFEETLGIDPLPRGEGHPVYNDDARAALAEDLARASEDRVSDVPDLLWQAKEFVAGLLFQAPPDAQLRMFALAADSENDELVQAFGDDGTIDETNDAEVEEFCEQVAEQTGGEFVLVVPELVEVPEFGSVEYIMLAHYSGGVGIGAAFARVNRQPGRAPALSDWQEQAPG